MRWRCNRNSAFGRAPLFRKSSKKIVHKKKMHLTEWLNGELEITDRDNKRLVRREAIQQQWQGDYSQLFDCDVSNWIHTREAISDIFCGSSETFLDYLQDTLPNIELVKKVELLRFRIGSPAAIRNHYRNAVKYTNTHLVQVLLQEHSQHLVESGMIFDAFIASLEAKLVMPLSVVESDLIRGTLWTILSNLPQGMKRHDNAMTAAVLTGDLQLVKFVHHNIHNSGKTNAMDVAAGCGHLTIVQWLHSNRSEGCTTNAMDGAAENGYLDVVQWLQQHRTEGCTQWALDEAAANGHMEVVQSLVNAYPSLDIQRAIALAEDNNEFETVYYLNQSI